MIGNLPAEPASFVGRADEREHVAGLLGRTRLVTLTGAGGVGKSRLAHRVAADAHRRFPDGVWLVELSSLRDPRDLAPLIAETLGGPGSGASHNAGGSDGPGTGALAEHIGGRRMLLLLDTCEHLLGACAELVGGLLERCPGLRVLTTGREPLDVPGEHVVTVLPLGDDAVTLFADRAVATVPDFVVDGTNRDQVVRLCEGLDGVPLAIELAATRLRALSVTDITARLPDRFRLLRRPDCDTGESRHRTLRTAIGWSHELCEPRERLLWARLSVFSHGFDRETAEEVCAGGALSRGDVFALLARLVEKSVLSREGDRYRLLHAVRAYGAERLRELGEEEAARDRHRDAYLRLARRAEAEWAGPAQLAWARRMTEDLPNFLAALDHSLAGDPRAAIELAGTLWPLWIACGGHREGRHYLERALAASGRPTPHRVKALWAAAWVEARHFDVGRARTRMEECRRSLGTAVWGIHAAAVVAFAAGDDENAVRGFDAVLAARGGAGPVWLLGQSPACVLGQAGLSLARSGGERAREVLDDAMWRSALTGDCWSRSVAHQGLAVLGWENGDLVGAEEQNRESIRLSRDLGDLAGALAGFELQSWIAAATGRGGLAATLLGAVEGLGGSTGIRLDEAPYWGARHSTCADIARGLVGGPTFRTAFAEGAALDLDAVYRRALGDPPKEGACLTPRESQVAELIADGLSNRELAERLMIAERTADTHVENILAKLRMSSRVQIAAWVAVRRSARS
ncbi:LuxR C-terminal-related transcriptional regulator [Microtetraspora sp. NBRC 16547]|uniref:ATP-binding protein n=1 Tax=Microtetraspora sp. NBRC 16547 TaxID=3030993 RepID=UPI0024A0BE6A|nr:LuxR C-terminal-related transcriptional regulator [Microtetraspora sp. NBRC 16547]GLW96346.1 LuxR family transcriptional regulator [Microtetraspora sp. NBRC 16547]